MWNFSSLVESIGPFHDCVKSPCWSLKRGCVKTKARIQKSIFRVGFYQSLNSWKITKIYVDNAPGGQCLPNSKIFHTNPSIFINSNYHKTHCSMPGPSILLKFSLGFRLWAVPLFSYSSSRAERKKQAARRLVAVQAKKKGTTDKASAFDLSWPSDFMVFISNLINRSEMPAPTDKARVQRLLGLAQNLSKFLPRLSGITKPLRELMQNDVQWTWKNVQEEAF